MLFASSVLAATARLELSDDLPQHGHQIEMNLVVDLTQEGQALGAFAAQLTWDDSVLKLVEVRDGTTAEFANPLKRSASGQLRLSQFHVVGASGSVNLAQVVFDVVGKARTQTNLNLSFDVLDQAQTFVSLLSGLHIQPATVMVQTQPEPLVPRGSVVLSSQIADTGNLVEAEILLDMSKVNLNVGAYAAQLTWDASVLQLHSVHDGTTAAFVKPQMAVASDGITFSNLNVQGEAGLLSLLSVTFEVIGFSGQSSRLNLSFHVLDQAGSFVSLLPDLQIEANSFLVGAVGLLDFDHSGSVDFPDFLFFVGKFGAQLGEENFDSRCDLDANGAIDFSDFLIFTQAFSM